MKKLICVIMAAALLICGCSKEEQTDERWPIEIDGYTFSAPPKKVVSLSPGVTESLYMLGYGGFIVGISDNCKLPDAADDMPRCGTAIFPDLSDITKLKPDLVFTSAALSKHDKKAIEEAGGMIVEVTAAESVEGLLKNSYLICAAFEGKEKAELKQKELTKFFEVTQKYIAAELKNEIESGETTAIYLRKLPFIMATGETLESEFLTQMGFVNAAKQYSDWSYPSEEAAALMPDYIFCDDSISLEDLQASVYYKATPAVLNEKVYTLSAEDFERRSARIFFALESLAEEILPDGFEDKKPNFKIKIQPPPEPEKSWWEKLFFN